MTLLLRAALCVLSAVWLGCSAGESGNPAAPETGAAAVGAAGDGDTPTFTLPDLRGNGVDLATFRGKTVVIDFWATWCPPCVYQVPELNKLWEAHEDAGDLMVIGVAVDVEGAEIVGPWVEEQGVVYTIVIGNEDIAKDFGALGFPTLVVLAPDGSVDSTHVGLIELDELEEIVAKASGNAT